MQTLNDTTKHQVNTTTPNWQAVLNWANAGNATPPSRVEKSYTDWQAQLTPEQYYVTREKGTERAFSSGMCSLFEPVKYHCICCDTLLFDANNKFDSGTGWPSFTEPVTDGVVGYHADGGHGMQRIEATCNVCDAHLGHVFPDGPKPSGLRYCMNAVSLKKASD